MSDQHRVPAVDRTIAVLDVLEKHRQGLTLPELAAAIEVPRTTVYRILNSLEAANFVRRAPRTGRYALGTRLLGLAASVRRGFHPLDLAALARPHLERLSALTGEASKLSVLDGEAALVLDAVTGSSDYSIVPTVGHRLPLHAGAASKVLFAGLGAERIAALLRHELTAHSRQTVTDGRALARELEAVAANGWAEDRGEFHQSVCAIAAPVVDGAARVVGAVSLAYLADRHGSMKAGHLATLQRCCAAISQELAQRETGAPDDRRPRLALDGARRARRA